MIYCLIELNPFPSPPTKVEKKNESAMIDVNLGPILSNIAIKMINYLTL